MGCQERYLAPVWVKDSPGPRKGSQPVRGPTRGARVLRLQHVSIPGRER